MHLVFVHGWSVTSTDTYGQLPLYLRQQVTNGDLHATVSEVFLGKYVSFEDTVTVDDIARAFDAALRDHPILKSIFTTGQKMACITHSTGGPVVRQWVDRYYKSDLAECPMTHLIMCAPANHGSALAQLGKGRLSRINSFFHGVEPGQRVLDWLELGSDESWALNENWLTYDATGAGLYSFVLQGQSIDRSLYDALNSYTDEMGSDGVVRVAGANMNYGFLRLTQSGGRLEVDTLTQGPASALAILPGRSHSGDDMGIIRSVTLANAADHPTTKAILRCLDVDSAADYAKVIKEFKALSDATQDAERTIRKKIAFFTRTFKTDCCSMIVFKLRDDTGQSLRDYDVRITAGPDYDDNALPPGFFIDRQRNSRDPAALTYYVNHDVLFAGLEGRLENKLGFDITARPTSGLSHYSTASFRGTADDIGKALLPNQTLMIEVILRRNIDRQVFTISDNLTSAEDISSKATGIYLP